LQCYLEQRDVHSFPTRRSSDLKRYLVNNYGFTSNLKRKNFIFKFNYFLSNLYLEYLSKKYANHFLTTAGELHFNTLKKVDIFNRSEEHTSELQSRENLVCRLLL